MRFGRALPTVLALWAIGAAAVARAQGTPEDPTRFIGRPVAAVQVQVEGVADKTDRYRDLIALKPGEPFRIEDMRNTTTRLYRTQRFEDVQTMVRDTPAGLELILNLIPRHPVERVAFEGETGLPVDDLERAVRERFGTRLSRILADDLALFLEQLLVDEGFLSAKVDAEARPDHVSERSTLVARIQAGPGATIAKIDIRGEHPRMTSEAVLKRLGMVPGAPYRPTEIRARLTQIEDDLRADGYYLATAELSAQPSPDRTTVDVAVTVNAGPRVELRWEGDPPGKADDLVGIKREASADQDLLDDAEERIRQELQRDGYWHAKVDHRRELDSKANTLVITFTLTPGRRFHVNQVVVSGNTRIDTAEIQRDLHVGRGDLFREADVHDGVRRIRLRYVSDGFAAFKVETTFDEVPADRPDQGQVDVRITLVEGPRTVVAAVTFEGVASLAESDLRDHLSSKPGDPFVDAFVAVDARIVEAAYKDRGFRSVAVSIDRVFSPDRSTATLAVKVTEGLQVSVGDIAVVGYQRVSPQLILEELALKVGEPLGDAAITESYNRLRDLDAFRSVTIEPEPLLPGETRATVLVTVEEAPRRSFGFGGGIEYNRRLQNELAPRGFIELGWRNLGGRNRSLNFFARTSLRRQQDGTGLRFSEYRATTTFRERKLFRSETDLLIALNSEQALRTSFSFLRHTASVEGVRHLTPQLTFSARYALERTELFDENIPIDDQPLVDRLFPQVRLSVLATGFIMDRRDNPLRPSQGLFTTGDVETALRALGSEVGYAKTFMQLAGYRRLGRTDLAIGAWRVQYGAARGFTRTVERVDEFGEPVIGPDGQQIVDVIQDIPASQRFFAGGATTVRGFDIDRLGVPEIINPAGFSVGGNGLIILNAELRLTPTALFGRPLTVVGFLDGGNVFAKASDVDLGRIRGTYGFGVRYDSPLGPLRLDFGFKMDRLFIGGQRERGWAWHLNFGEAF